MKTICITLPNATERQKKTTETLSAIKMPFSFFYGVDARTDSHPLLERYDDKIFQNNMGRPAAIGEIGCYASHFLAWQLCVEENEPLIIFEDDLDIEHDLFQRTIECAEKYINECGYIRIENTKNLRMFYQVKPLGQQSLVKYLRIPQCMTGYVLTPTVARKLIEASSSFEYPVDVFLRNAWIHKQPIFGIHQAGLRGGTAPSIIGNRKRTGKKNYYVAMMKILNKAKNMSLNLITNIYHLWVLKPPLRPKLFVSK